MATNPHPLTLDAAIKLLTSTMRDPWKANVCSTRMAVAADRIDLALEARDSVSAKIKLAKSHPELLRAGIKFLTFKQSPQDFMTMINHLIQCRCDFGQTGMRRLHKPSRYRPDGRILVTGSDLIFDAVATVTNCIILALSELTQHRFHTENANSDEQRWPQGPEDLLPFGPKDSMAGLEHWVAGPPSGYIIFKLAGCLASSHVPFAREVFQSPKFTFALCRPCQHLEVAIKFYHEGDTSPLARMHFFTNPIMTIFQFFDNLSSIDTPQYNMMMIAGRDWLKPILTPLMTILSTLPPEWSKIRMHLNYLSSYANAEVDPKTGVAFVKFERSQFAEAIKERDPLEDAFNTMVDARKRGCSNIQCPSQSEALHSRLCSKCNLIRFCGEKCQKDAWKAASLPHKAVCAKIYSLKEALGSADWSLLWTPDFTYAQFQAMCRTKNVDMEAVKIIESTISALRIRKSAFLEDLKKAGASQKDQLIRAEQERFALQKSKDIIAGLGDQVMVIPNREEGFLRMHPDAYILGGNIRRETSLDDLD